MQLLPRVGGGVERPYVVEELIASVVLATADDQHTVALLVENCREGSALTRTGRRVQIRPGGATQVVAPQLVDVHRRRHCHRIEGSDIAAVDQDALQRWKIDSAVRVAF